MVSDVDVAWLRPPWPLVRYSSVRSAPAENGAVEQEAPGHVQDTSRTCPGHVHRRRRARGVAARAGGRRAVGRPGVQSPSQCSPWNADQDAQDPFWQWCSTCASATSTRIHRESRLHPPHPWAGAAVPRLRQAPLARRLRAQHRRYAFLFYAAYFFFRHVDSELNTGVLFFRASAGALAVLDEWLGTF